MTLQQMEIFLIVARYGSFTAAAKEFFTTQPTVSRQISLLEDELGYPLFDRQEKPLKLTAAGKVIFEEFDRIVDEVHNAMIHGKKIANGEKGRLSIAFLKGLNIEDHLKELFDNLQNKNPELKIKFEKVSIPQARQKLLAGQIDILISLNLSMLHQEDLIVHELFPIETFILMNSHHRLASKEEIEKNDLFDEKIYLPNPVECFSFENNQFFGYNIQRNNILEVDDIETAFLNIRFADGITCGNTMMPLISDENNYKKFPVLDDRFVKKVCLAWRKNNQNPAIDFFYRQAKAVLNDRK